MAVLDLERPCTIDDVCDFVVQYIESDILGLLADRHLTIAGTESSPVLLPMITNSLSVDQSAVGTPMMVHGMRGSDILETVRCPGSGLRDVGGTLLEIGRFQQERGYVLEPS